MDKVDIELNLQSDKLCYYSPYHFIPGIDLKVQAEVLISKCLPGSSPNQEIRIIEISTANHIHYFYLTHLSWDSQYFQIPVYKIIAVGYQHSDFTTLLQAINLFRNTFVLKERKYCFVELPSEDILLLQAFTGAGFRLIETRVAYYKENIELYENERFSVRTATIDDIPNLKRIAAQTRNPYDRVHADSFFKQEVADTYLATYVEQAVNGFADIVLVPDENNMPPDAFIAISYLSHDSQALQCQLSQIMLTAVAPLCKGWHYKLVSEAIYHVKSKGVRYLLMTTQSANRAVVRNCEKLGFRFGACSQILSYYVE